MRLLGYLIWTIQLSEQLPLLSLSFSCPEPERSSQGPRNWVGWVLLSKFKFEKNKIKWTVVAGTTHR